MSEKLNILNTTHAHFWQHEKVDESSLIKSYKEETIAPLVSELLYRKGVYSEDMLDTYISCPLKNLGDPFLLTDMRAAVDRLYYAIENRQNILVYGDFDVDGVASSSLFLNFFELIDYPLDSFIPNRLTDGYGLTLKSIDQLVDRKPDLIITVDCGINSVDEVAYCKEVLNCDIIVTDHHTPSDTLPSKAVAVINPLRDGDKYPFKGLSGVGVAFKIVTALRHELNQRGYFERKGIECPNIRNLMDMVALGTISDLMPLVDENRIMVSHGLEVIRSGKSKIGIKTLIKTSGVDIEHLKVSNIAFSIAPKINAVGRMGNSRRGVDLLTTKDEDLSKILAIELENENRLRQTTEREIYDKCIEKVESENLHNTRSGLVLYGENWHIGVLGIVASKIVEKYHMPTVIMGIEDSLAKGSARSIIGVNILDVFNQSKDLIKEFGGHIYAAGLKVPAENLEQFATQFDQSVREITDDSMKKPTLNIDSIVELKDIDSEFEKWLKNMEPFGNGHQDPILLSRGAKLMSGFALRGEGGKHLQGSFEQNGCSRKVIFFNYERYKFVPQADRKYDIIYKPKIDYWRGRKQLQLQLLDATISE